MDHSFLYQLPSDELFTLDALISQEVLSVESHAKIFRQTEQTSELLLERMVHNGILIKKQKGYVVHFFLYRPIVRALIERNILH